MRFRFAALLLCTLGCTDVGLYALSGVGAEGPDRVAFKGEACLPLAVGSAFPVKVLFVVPGGPGVPPEVNGAIVDTLTSITTRFTQPYVRFGLAAYHTLGVGLQSSFADAATVQTNAIPLYATFNETGPWSLRNGLRLAEALLTNDMLSLCRGTVARTRYVVVLLAVEPDTSCDNPAWNIGISNTCVNQATIAACNQCEVSRASAAIRGLADTLGAGQVTVQPILVRTELPDAGAPASPAIDELRAQLLAVARAGDSGLLEANYAFLNSTVNGLDFSSFQQNLVLKRLIAFNRNTLSQAGQVVIDSDGDGLGDADERTQNLAPDNPDTDADGVMDGVERRMGLDPGVANVFSGCSPFEDQDGDRLNDCEERVLGTDSCVGDSDGDGLPDIVEALSSSNPLLPEDLLDSDRDGAINAEEIASHTDPLSADLAFKTERGYDYQVSEPITDATGRVCYQVRAGNITVVNTLQKQDPLDPLSSIPAGSNDLYLYFQVSRPNVPHGVGVGSVTTQRVVFTPPGRKEPRSVIGPNGVIPIDRDSFRVGQ